MRNKVRIWHSVRVKFVFFTIALLIFVIFFVSVPVVIGIFQPYRRIVIQGLLDRTKILLDNLDLNVRDYLKNPGVHDDRILVFQDIFFDDVTYIVVTGRSPFPDQQGIDYVLFSGTTNLNAVISTKEYSHGISKFCPTGIDDILAKVTAIEDQANHLMNDFYAKVTQLHKDEEMFKFYDDREAFKYKQNVQNTIHQMEIQMQQQFIQLVKNASGAFPEYTVENLAHNISEYLFYKPILEYDIYNYYAYVSGIVFVNVSIAPILAKIKSEHLGIIYSTIQVTLVVLFFGILASWGLTSIIVSPIRTLAAHVAMIRDTEDKEKLAGKSVIVNSKDELGMLGDTINDMTERLAAAASLTKDLKFGKEIQKMFIPLELSSSGRKLTTGSHRDTYSEFFGYYEGAHGVSGDYFDYIKLDPYHYAVIKCDVAGKGVPAALIMVEVATLFQSYFKDWNYQTDGYNLSPIVTHINDVVESRGFVGRFAAFSLCVINMRSGDAYFCNAGDNIVTIYRQKEQCLHSYTLHSSSAAGAFSSDLINLKGGFPVEKLHLNCGDILFLYTDGIEEAKRVITTTMSEESDAVVDTTEEFGKARVKAVLEAVFARKQFTLRKVKKDSTYKEMVFDFSNCDGTIEDAVMALVSAEKVFRMYTDSDAHIFDCVQVDKKIDAFLAKYFLQYTHYCKQKEPHPIYNEYYYYRNVKEDVQYDDLTILGIMRRILL